MKYVLIACLFLTACSTRAHNDKCKKAGGALVYSDVVGDEHWVCVKILEIE